MRSLLTTLAFLLPFKRLKVQILNRLGHDIHPTVLIGVCLVRHVRRFELAEGAKIGHFNQFIGLELVHLGRGSRIIYFNQVMSGFTRSPASRAAATTARCGWARTRTSSPRTSSTAAAA
jgi:hypothetical protein